MESEAESLKYIQKLDTYYLPEDFTFPKGLIINFLDMSWNGQALDLLENENIQIINASISIEDVDDIPEELELSKSNKKSLKKIMLRLRNIFASTPAENQEDQNLWSNKVTNLVKTLKKDFEVEVFCGRDNEVADIFQFLPREVKL